MKNLLIITQKVDENDGVLGFFHEWIRDFSREWERVTVICLKCGEYDLPANTHVFSLGKEKGLGRFSYLGNFYKYIWHERKNYDAVFVHMNPKYVPLGWLIWRMSGKTISLWYAHGHVPSMLRIADALADIVFTSTAEGYRLKSSKLKIVGQGIDVKKFIPQNPKMKTDADKVFRIISIGRISPSKDYETLIAALEILATKNQIKVEIVGSPANSEDFEYLEMLKNMVVEKRLRSVITFLGPVANKDIVPILQSADLFVNMGHTGSLDKANLEAMACGLPILTCNEAYENILGEYRTLLMYPKKDFRYLAEKIEYFINAEADTRLKIGHNLRSIVVKDHNLDGLIQSITTTLKAATGNHE